MKLEIPSGSFRSFAILFGLKGFLGPTGLERLYDLEDSVLDYIF
jgi:hypothetical protein